MRVVSEYSYPDAPIELVNLQLGSKPFIDRGRVMAGNDWLKNLKLNVKNISRKSILAFDLSILVEKQENMEAAVNFPILFRTFTKTTPLNATTPTGKAKLGTLKPDEIVQVHISEMHLKAFGEILKKYEVDDVRRVRLYIQTVYFEDGTEWAFGKYSRPSRSTVLDYDNKFLWRHARWGDRIRENVMYMNAVFFATLSNSISPWDEGTQPTTEGCMA